MPLEVGGWVLLWLVCPVSPQREFIYPSPLIRPLFCTSCSSHFGSFCGWGPVTSHQSYCRYCSHGCLHRLLFRVCPNWYWVLTCLSFSMSGTPCRSQLAAFTRSIKVPICRLKYVLMERLAKMYGSSSFLRHSAALLDFPFSFGGNPLILLFPLESSVTPAGLRARGLVFSLLNALISSFCLRFVWKCLCGFSMNVIQSSSVQRCEFVPVQCLRYDSSSLWAVASGLFHSLPCHNKHSVAVFHPTCAHS